jgi:hypothetical protein
MLLNVSYKILAKAFGQEDKAFGFLDTTQGAIMIY